jgi:hypothetical protein
MGLEAQLGQKLKLTLPTSGAMLQQFLELVGRQSRVARYRPIVIAFTGLFRGIVTKRTPFDITICLPSRTILKPAFCKARTARR